MNPAKKVFNCIIVDDDEIDRLMTVSLVRRYDFLNIIDISEFPEKALINAQNKQLDILFLDIDMPGISGLDLRKQLQSVPACIFITSHAEYAVESFELDALDFLVKPLKTDRFDIAMNRLKNYMDLRHKADLLDYTLGGDSIFIKQGHEQIKLKLHEILYLEALKDYTRIITHNKRYCVLSSISNLLKEISFQSFIRIHRSYAVQKHFMNKITANNVLIGDISLPIGRVYKAGLNKL